MGKKKLYHKELEALLEKGEAEIKAILAKHKECNFVAAWKYIFDEDVPSLYDKKTKTVLDPQMTIEEMKNVPREFIDFWFRQDPHFLTIWSGVVGDWVNEAARLCGARLNEIGNIEILVCYNDDNKCTVFDWYDVKSHHIDIGYRYFIYSRLSYLLETLGF